MPTPKILITDHYEPYLDMMTDVLRDAGYLDVTCYTGPLTFEHIRDIQPDLALIDLNNADAGSGWVLIDMLRLDPATRRIPIIICSTDPTLLVTKAKLLERLQCSFLEKPFDIDTLIAVITAAVGPPASRPR